MGIFLFIEIKASYWIVWWETTSGCPIPEQGPYFSMASSQTYSILKTLSLGPRGGFTLFTFKILSLRWISPHHRRNQKCVMSAWNLCDQISVNFHWCLEPEESRCSGAWRNQDPLVQMPLPTWHFRLPPPSWPIHGREKLKFNLRTPCCQDLNQTS